MSNYNNLKKELLTYLKARIPFIVVQTIERERVERMLTEIHNENNIDMDFYSDSKQLYKPDSLTSGKNIASDPIQYATDSFKKKSYSTLVIFDINHISNDNSFSRDVLNTLYLARENHCTIIAVTGDVVWMRLINLGLVTTLDFPDELERANQLISFINRYKNKYPIDWTKEDLIFATTILKGFSEMQIDNILSAEIAISGGLYRDKIYKLTEQKNRLFGSIPNVEYIQLDDTITVAGLDNLKKWLNDKRNVFFAPDATLKKYDLTPPKGLLLAGVPGCGKSLTAKLISQEWKLPLFKFNLDTIYDKWVGESERKMHDALTFIDHIAPCILWVDEIEKALSSSDAGNDTGKRIVSQFLFWLQESKSKVFLVATANDISLLPPELFRKGRFSEIFFIDLPNKEERRQTILHYLQKSLHYEANQTEVETLVNASNGFSYADIETAIKETTQLIILNPNTEITIELIVSKFNSIIPFYQSNPELINKSREWGYKRACLASSESEE